MSRIIGYSYGADRHCVACTQAAHAAGDFGHDATAPAGDDEHGIPYAATDQEGNAVHRIFSTDEGSEEGDYCGECDDEIMEPWPGTSDDVDDPEPDEDGRHFVAVMYTYSGMSYRLQEEPDTLDAARAIVAAWLRRARRRGAPVEVIRKGLEYEIQTPADAAIIGDRDGMVCIQAVS